MPQTLGMGVHGGARRCMGVHGGACLWSQHLRQRQRSGVQGDPWHMRPYLKITERHACLGLALCLFPVAALISCHKYYLTVLAVRVLVSKTCASSSGRKPACLQGTDGEKWRCICLSTSKRSEHTHRHIHTHAYAHTNTQGQACDPSLGR